jgi:hypothetical protein
MEQADARVIPNHVVFDITLSSKFKYSHPALSDRFERLQGAGVEAAQLAEHCHNVAKEMEATSVFRGFVYCNLH